MLNQETKSSGSKSTTGKGAKLSELEAYIQPLFSSKKNEIANEENLRKVLPLYKFYLGQIILDAIDQYNNKKEKGKDYDLALKLSKMLFPEFKNTKDIISEIDKYASEQKNDYKLEFIPKKELDAARNVIFSPGNYIFSFISFDNKKEKNNSKNEKSDNIKPKINEELLNQDIAYLKKLNDEIFKSLDQVTFDKEDLEVFERTGMILSKDLQQKTQARYNTIGGNPGGELSKTKEHIKNKFKITQDKPKESFNILENYTNIASFGNLDEAILFSIAVREIAKDLTQNLNKTDRETYEKYKKDHFNGDLDCIVTYTLEKLKAFKDNQEDALKIIRENNANHTEAILLNVFNEAILLNVFNEGRVLENLTEVVNISKYDPCVNCEYTLANLINNINSIGGEFCFYSLLKYKIIREQEDSNLTMSYYQDDKNNEEETIYSKSGINIQEKIEKSLQQKFDRVLVLLIPSLEKIQDKNKSIIINAFVAKITDEILKSSEILLSDEKKRTMFKVITPPETKQQNTQQKQTRIPNAKYN